MAVQKKPAARITAGQSFDKGANTTPGATEPEVFSLDPHQRPATPVEFLKAWAALSKAYLSPVMSFGKSLDDEGKEKDDLKKAPFKSAQGHVDKYDGKLGIYFTIAATKTALGTKAKKHQMAGSDWLWVEIDPRKDRPLEQERERIRKVIADGARHLPPATVVIDSGRGYWLFWLLSERCTDHGRVEKLLRGLVLLFEGDRKSAEISHVGRLPFTMNVKPGGKRADIVEWRTHIRFKIDDLDRRITESVSAQEGDANGLLRVSVAVADADIKEIAPAAYDDIEELIETLPARLQVLAREGTLESIVGAKTNDNTPSAWQWDFICNALRAGVAASAIKAIIVDRDLAISSHTYKGGGRNPNAYADRQIARAQSTVAQDAPRDNVVPLRVVPSADARIAGRRRIYYSDNELPRVLDEAEAVLIERDVSLYQQLGRLVRVTQLGVSIDDAGNRRAAGPRTIQVADPRWTRDEMQRAINFYRTDGNKEIAATIKLDDVRQYHARAGSWNVRPLDGIVLCPMMVDLEGSIADKNGYDAKHRLVVDTQGVDFPPIPERPTYQDARAALATLIELFKHFPFESGDSRSVALAGILTAVSRRAYRSAPIFGYSAPMPGTGKTLCADTPAYIATGKKPTTITFTGDDVEDEKRLASILLAGDPVILIDNLSVPIQGDFWCAVTTGEPRMRVLGKSETLAINSQVLFQATGNNLQFSGDTTRRSLECRLDAKMEHPEKRPLSTDRYYADLQRDRPRLAVAALTILRAYAQAGRPKPDAFETMGNFEDWSDLVCGALVWLGEEDPRRSRERIAAGDDRKTTLAELIDAMKQEIGVGAGYKMTARRMIEHSEQSFEVDEDGSNVSHLLRVLPDACADRLGRTDVTPKRLGEYLRRMSGHTLAGLRIRHEGGTNRSKAFWLEAIDGATSAPSRSPERLGAGGTPKGSKAPF